MMKRSDFLKLGLTAGMLPTFMAPRGVGAETATTPGPLPRRPLGRTGETLSVIGFGGIVVRDSPQDVADKAVRDAVEAGVNYFDVAPRYGDAELKLGPALEPFRKNVFLSCKTAERDAKGSEAQLHESLRRARTDHFDLYQMHFLFTKEDIDRGFGPGGAIETLVKAKKEGLTRFLGFSSHSVEAALAAMDLYDFDTVMFPINYACWYKENFGPQVVERDRSKGMGVIAIKAGVHGNRPHGQKSEYPKEWYNALKTPEELAMGYFFTLSLPVTTAVPPGEEEFFRRALKIAVSFVPPSEAEKEKIKQAASSVDTLFKYPVWPS
jgi:predicted aldo/keto reductase-like oxidoreductase